ncbi:MAG: ABC transporter ATP-binding protein, partial [Ilumatobacteraceae bacterium]
MRAGPGGRFGAAGMPTERSKDFGNSVKRLMRRLQPDRLRVVAVLFFAVVAVTLTVVGPKLLGQATDVIYRGLTSKEGINFDDLHRVLMMVVGLYVVAATMTYTQAYLLAGIVQRTMYRLRADVEDKLNRLPLSYVDRQPRGDLLSRVTNDIDNISQSLQQTLSQMVTSVLSITGVLIMMLTISPVLALVAIVTIPLSLYTVKWIAKRSKARFIAQWKHTGMLNAQIEETFSGHNIVKAFGRQREAEERFRVTNEELYQASFGAQFASGTIQPAMMFLGNLNFVAIAVIGGLRVSSGALSLGDVQAFIQYSRQFTQPLTQFASMMNVLQSGIASAERCFELLDAPEQSPDDTSDALDGARRGRVEFEHVSFSYSPSMPLIQDLSLVAEPGRTVAIVGPTGACKTTLVNLIMRFYELDSGRITLDGHDIAKMSRHE